jgi:hypothetical protein
MWNHPRFDGPLSGAEVAAVHHQTYLLYAFGTPERLVASPHRLGQTESACGTARMSSAPGFPFISIDVTSRHFAS